jgi:predicted Fe-Mo cluster-binding NifX family protein
MKIAVTAQGTDINADVDPRFGRSRYFIVVDTDNQEVSAVDNEVNLNATQGAGIQAGKKVVELGVQAVITGHVGPKAFATLQAGNIDIYNGATGTVADAIEQFNGGKLQKAQNADVKGHWM